MAQVLPAPIFVSAVTIRRAQAGSMTEALRAIDRSAQTNGQSLGEWGKQCLTQGSNAGSSAAVITTSN